MLTVGELMPQLFQFFIMILALVIGLGIAYLVLCVFVGIFKSVKNGLARNKDRSLEYEKAKEEIKDRARRRKEELAATSEKDDILMQKYEELRNELN